MDRFISVDEVIENAATIVPQADDSAKLIWKQWVYVGVKQIGVSLDNIQVCELKAHDRSFRKPNDLIIIDDIAIYDDSGNEYQYVYRGAGKRIHEATTPISQAPVDISEDDYYIHMGSNGEGITKAKIRYYALPIDEHGEILIPERYLYALMCFIDFLWAKRNKLASLDESKAEWEKQRRIQKSFNRVPSPLAAKASKNFNSMINKIFYEKF